MRFGTAAIGDWWHTADIARWTADAVVESVKPARRPELSAACVAILRDVAGNPFRPVTADPAWLTPTFLSLAHAAYDARQLPSGELDPVRLSVLADALEEAGAGGELLTHLRGPGPHVRGCWAVDLILGRG